MYYIRMYLEFVNEFVSVEAFANYFDMDVTEAKRVIRIGREMHECTVEMKMVEVRG